jgi:hypothetical protein
MTLYLPDLASDVEVGSTAEINFACAVVRPLTDHWHLTSRVGGTLLVHQLISTPEPITNRLGMTYHPTSTIAGFRFALSHPRLWRHPLAHVLLMLNERVSLEVWAAVGARWWHYTWATWGWRTDSEHVVIGDTFRAELLGDGTAQFGFVVPEPHRPACLKRRPSDGARRRRAGLVPRPLPGHVHRRAGTAAESVSEVPLLGSTEREDRMSNEVDYYDVQGMIRDSESAIRGEIDNRVREACRQLREEFAEELERVRDAMRVELPAFTLDERKP